MGFTNWGPVDLMSASKVGLSKRCSFVYVGRRDDGTGTLAHSEKRSFDQHKEVTASRDTSLKT